MIPLESASMDEIDNWLQILSEDWYYYHGQETCECGRHYNVSAPIQRVIAECVCGLLLDIILEEYDERV